MASDQTDILLNAIKCTQELRASVAHVFETLADGAKKTPDHENNQKAFLANLQQALLAVNHDMSELDKLRSSVTPIGSPPTLGNSGMLSLDPILDKTPIYGDLVQSYKRTNKIHDYATQAALLLQQGQLKRSHTSPVPSSKRPKKQSTTCHAVNIQTVENMVQNWGRMYQDMPIMLSRPMESPVVLQLTLGRTLKAIIVLRGLIIEWVLVKGMNESLNNDDNQVDIWTQSKYAVFQKITDHTSAAMLHFYSPVFPEIAVKSFLKWFHSYVGLFATPCHQCKKFLLDKLPPTWRDFRTYEAYHENCRPKMYM